MEQRLAKSLNFYVLYFYKPIRKENVQIIICIGNKLRIGSVESSSAGSDCFPCNLRFNF